MNLSVDQQKAIDLVNENHNVFITGSAGNGKSYLINVIAENPRTQVCASTGVAAFNISGITIHSFLNLGLGDRSTRESVSTMSFERKDFIRKLKCLVIDEISMISSELLDKISDVLSHIRQYGGPFGGLQVILCGDLLQLEPVSGTLVIKNDKFKKFMVVELTTNFRQSEDTQWRSMLSRMRLGKMTIEDHEILEGKVVENDDVFSIYPTNKDVNNVNKIRYSSIKEEEQEYLPVYSGKNYLVMEIKKQFAAKNMELLKLKVGARVMLLRNIDTENGLVNGALGLVTRLNYKSVVVLFDHMQQETLVVPIEFEKKIGKEAGIAKQIPLCLCFSSTIHKVQGLTFDECGISVGNSFANNMTYVALSRVKTMDGLRLLSYSKNRVKVNKEAIQFYDSIA